jgi:hypothetical protein
MTQAQVVREFDADPASVALLLAGPAGTALWPEVSADQPLVTLGPPMRAGVGFVVDLTVADPAVGSVRGRLALVPCSGQAAFGGTSARLLLTGAHASAPALRERGGRFLDALSSLAIARSSAA